MVDTKCRVIPEPAEGTRVVFKQTATKVPYFRDSGGSDRYLCGNCSFVLAREVTMDQIQQRIRTEGGKGNSAAMSRVQILQ